MSERFLSQPPEAKSESDNPLERLAKKLEAKAEEVRRKRQEFKEGKRGMGSMWLDALGTAFEVSSFLESKGSDLDQLIGESVSDAFKHPGSIDETVTRGAVGFTRILVEYEQEQKEQDLKMKDKVIKEIAKLQGAVEGLATIEAAEREMNTIIERKMSSDMTPQVREEGLGLEGRYKEVEDKERSARRQEAEETINSFFK